MKRHPVDVISLVFGLIFLAMGIPLALADSGFDLVSGRWLAPALLIAVGVVVLVSNLPGRSSARTGDDVGGGVEGSLSDNYDGPIR